MPKTHKTLIALITSLILGVAIMGVAVFGPQVTLALAQTPTPGAPNQPAGLAKYGQVFINSLASHLGIDVSKLDSALLAALNDTLSQAVKDGRLTQTQASQIEQRASQGITSGNGLIGLFGLQGGFRGNGIVPLGPSEFAKALGMNVQAVITELQSGKSIADIASEHHVDLNQVKQTVLADVKSGLNAAVSSGKITQAQADQEYQKISSGIDTLLNQKGLGHHSFPRSGGRSTQPTQLPLQQQS